MKRYINKKELPPWRIDELKISEKCRQAWGPMQKAFIEAETNSSFYLHRKLPDENVSEALNDYMLSEHNMRDVIRSRDELNAYGNDGISYRIMKAGPPEAAKFMK
jgi:hypothetical protein